MSEPITHGPTGLINWKARAKAAEVEIKALKADNDTFRAIIQGSGFRDGGFEIIRVNGKNYSPERIVAALAAESKLARLEGLLAAVLKRDAEWSLSGSPNDCGCIRLSREAEIEYETYRCPHQLARAYASENGE